MTEPKGFKRPENWNLYTPAEKAKEYAKQGFNTESRQAESSNAKKAESKAQETARKGNAEAITKASIAEKERNADPAYAERSAQETARKSNAEAINGNKFSPENPVPKPYETNAAPKPVTMPAPAPTPIQPKPAGMQVGNSNKDVANAKPGDWIIRKDGSKYILKPGDIAWAKSKFVKPAPAPAPAPMPAPVPTTKPEASAIQVTNKPNAEYVPNTNPDHKRESIAKRRVLEEKKNTPYQHMSDNDYLHAINSGALKHPGLKVTPGADGYYNYTFN